jgi:hypothetical protein
MEEVWLINYFPFEGHLDYVFSYLIKYALNLFLLSYQFHYSQLNYFHEANPVNSEDFEFYKLKKNEFFKDWKYSQLKSYYFV